HNLHEPASSGTGDSIIPKQTLLTHDCQNPVRRHLCQFARVCNCRRVGAWIAQPYVIELAHLRQCGDGLCIPTPACGQVCSLQFDGIVSAAEHHGPFQSSVIVEVAFEQRTSSNQTRLTCEGGLRGFVVQGSLRVQYVFPVNPVSRQISVE